jgi:short subunit dehydrogenase-like uncharacterized protein
MGLLIYGANGYSGELAARHAVDRGLRPVLAGRRQEALAPLAAELGLEARAFALDDSPAVARGLAGTTVVLSCAGPFSRTALPLARACLRVRAHYLDICRARASTSCPRTVWRRICTGGCRRRRICAWRLPPEAACHAARR